MTRVERSVRGVWDGGVAEGVEKAWRMAEHRLMGRMDFVCG